MLSEQQLVRTVAGAIAVVLGVAIMSVPAVGGPTSPGVRQATAARVALGPLWGPGVEPAPGAQPQPAPGEQPAPQPVPGEQPASAAAAAAPVAPPPAVARAAQRGDQILGALTYPWQELGFDVRFEPARDGLLGLTDYDSRVITVFVRPGQSDHSLQVTLAHELGHALDDVTGTDAQRARYRELRGLSSRTPWYPCSGCSDYASTAGDWAEVFALWLAGPGDFRSELAGPPDDRTLQEISRLFAPPSARSTVRAAGGASPPGGSPGTSGPPPSSPSPSPSPTRRPLVPDIPG